MDAAEPPLVAARPSHALRSKPSMKRRKAPPLRTIQTAAQGAGAAKDDAIGRIQPFGDLVDAKERSPPKPLGKVTRKVSATGRPIVPLTEQKSISRSRTLSIGKRDEERDRWDVAPDGASAGREGRQFTVANVGNNGKLFLRPSVRRGNKRYPQPNFTFPITPPGTAGLEGAYPDNRDEPPSLTADHHENQFTPTPRTSIIPPAYAPDLSNLASQHRRAVSDGTIRDFNSPTGTDTDGYRIVITKPTHGDDHRPKTTEHLEDLDVDGVPMLNINIPSWKLGTPRFSTRGTPMLRGSSYAPTDDFRSNSRASMYHSSERSLGAPLSGLRSRRPSHLVPPKLRFPRTSHASSQASTRPPRVVPSTYASTHLIIEPDMFDELTFKPTCDDKLIVRYSPSGSVTAATPSRLVAEITSPSFLDYELISDFFLTFRAFLEPDILLRMLMARLRWALERTDEIGMIVRVRTFVAMRHWILNYFVDDFVLDYDLRVIFCILLNDLFDELSQDARERRVQLKILTELKKCWRRICAHYWDGPDFDDSLGPGAPVAPGGIAGYRDPNLDPTFWEREGVDPPQWHAVSGIPDGLSDAPNSSVEDVPTTARFGDFTVSDHRPGTPEHQIITTTMVSNGPASPLSIASMDIVSCSFPTKNVRSLNPNSSQPLAAHPVYSTSPILAPGAIATTPKALSGKRVRPAQSHGRNNSATDSIRAPSSDHSSSQDVDLHMILQSAGNLVRGNILPPGQPFVDIESGTPTGDNRQTTIFQPVSRNAPKDRIFGVAMSGSGMKKFLGGVRRALNNRGQWSSGSHTSLPAVASLSAHTVSIDRLPGTAIITQGGYAQTTSRPQVRIDVLGAEVAEDFKRAIREEEEAAEAERLGVPRPAPTPSSTRRRRHMEYSVAHMESSTGDYVPQNRRSRPMSDMGLTTGSQSIVIVDDTVPFDMPGIRDRLPAATFNPSAGGLSVGSFLTAGGDPTPPTTPPAQPMAGTPRRSSYLLDQLVALPSASQGESLPPFVPDMATLGHSHTYSQGQSDDASRVSFSTMRRSIQRRPPLSRGTLRVHRRNQSTNTQQSSYSFRRHASFGSHLERHSTARSFDATTDSSLLDREYEVPAVEPPRMLRRRPGGYLRAAVNNAGGLNNQPTVRKSHSVGSLTNYTDSVRSSYLLGTHAEQDDDDRSFSGAGDHPRERQEIFSVGQLTEKPAKRHLSLFSTHSSKPIMRPSFEIEARKLAQIPDEDDGGIESALLKLEGKYQPKPKSFEQLRQTAMIDANEFGGQAATANSYASENQSQESEAGGMDDEYQSWDKGKQPQDTEHNRDTLIAHSRVATLETRSFLTADSDESYCSIPLLERGLTDDGQSNRGTSQWTNRSVLRGSSDEDDATTSDLVATRSHQASHQASSSHLSYDFVQKTESIERVKTRKTASLPVAEDQTFLEDASVGGSDLSSELSPSEDEGSNNYRERAGVFSISSQPHPFGDPIATPRSNSSSAPMTLAQALAMSPVMMSPVLTNTERTLDLDQIWTRTPLPLSPEIFQDGPNTAEHVPPRTSEALPPLPQPETPNTLKYSIHLPFILAFESDILAQQFTLIEKDALNDIDWRELIEMNWRNATSNDSRSWVDFLRNTNAHGVEVVVARFNIMVKWAISEIVLTQHIEERARCIIKLIHIAAHCRRYRNFATLAQLTIALSSAEVARLSKTWDLVPARDLNTLGELEALVTPSRNFYSLRAEMEVGSDGGCIPFVGIYTHDLLFNAQRPSEIASSPTTPPLINFERCRIGAAVVKTLLRLLEASTRYTFQPIEGITERCLWMGALNDDEIRRHSEALE